MYQRMLQISSFVLLLVGSALAQIPDTFKNLQVLDKNISKAELVSTMRGYAGSLGVRCTFCHAGPDNLQGIDFSSDSLEHKKVAREMMKMVASINGTSLPAALNKPAAELTGTVNCMTCHRGSKEPIFIEDVLMRAHKAGGSDSAITAYRNLREVWYGRAKYDFGAPPLTNFSSTLFDTDTIGAMALQAMNVEFNPKSIDAVLMYAQMLLTLRDSSTALYYIDSALVMSPQHRGATSLKKAMTDNGFTKATAPAQK